MADGEAAATNGRRMREEAVLEAGALAPGAFRRGSVAIDADDRILYGRGTGALYFDADGAGGADAVQFATLSPRLDVSIADFLVI